MEDVFLSLASYRDQTSSRTFLFPRGGAGGVGIAAGGLYQPPAGAGRGEAVVRNSGQSRSHFQVWALGSLAARGSHLCRVRMGTSRTTLNQRPSSRPPDHHSNVTFSGSPPLASFTPAALSWPHRATCPLPAMLNCSPEHRWPPKPVFVPDFLTSSSLLNCKLIKSPFSAHCSVPSIQTTAWEVWTTCLLNG